MGDKAYRINIRIFVYSSYDYTSRLMIRIINYINKIISGKKLVDIIYSFDEVSK